MPLRGPGVFGLFCSGNSLRWAVMLTGMKTTHSLDLADIKAIAAAAEAEALKNKWAVTIAIVDAGGHLLWLNLRILRTPIY